MASFDIDGELVRKLADLLRETGLNEMEYAEGDRRIRVTRQSAISAVNVGGPIMSAPAPLAVPSGGSRPAGGGSAVPPGAVTSPMVGTAYVAAEPGGPPFVRPGEAVKVGQTVMIIEAMKVMNPIKAPRSGTVAQVLVSDAQPVEFGEVLLIIE
ncbi:MAG: acetyl-CoA carboxylase biotin carboxyl carrier protein subunit [Rhodospirillaceae bacterium]